MGLEGSGALVPEVTHPHPLATDEHFVARAQRAPASWSGDRPNPMRQALRRALERAAHDGVVLGALRIQCLLPFVVSAIGRAHTVLCHDIGKHRNFPSRPVDPEFVSVKGQAGFQSKRIAGTEPGRHGV